MLLYEQATIGRLYKPDLKISHVSPEGVHLTGFSVIPSLGRSTEFRDWLTVVLQETWTPTPQTELKADFHLA